MPGMPGMPGLRKVGPALRAGSPGAALPLLASAACPSRTALYQWQQGERRLQAAPAERRRLLERVTDALVAELRRRLGGRFSADELADLYDAGTGWCLQVAMKVAPEDPWAWDAGLVADAAFARYLREASDYAGGRLEIAES